MPRHFSLLCLLSSVFILLLAGATLAARPYRFATCSIEIPDSGWTVKPEDREPPKGLGRMWVVANNDRMTIRLQELAGGPMADGPVDSVIAAFASGLRTTGAMIKRTGTIRVGPYQGFFVSAITFFEEMPQAAYMVIVPRLSGGAFEIFAEARDTAIDLSRDTTVSRIVGSFTIRKASGGGFCRADRHGIASDREMDEFPYGPLFIVVAVVVLCLLVVLPLRRSMLRRRRRRS